jgi:hypothetical protein
MLVVSRPWYIQTQGGQMGKCSSRYYSFSRADFLITLMCIHTAFSPLGQENVAKTNLDLYV